MEHDIVEKKFLEVVKSLKKYNESLDIGLYRVGGCVRDKYLGLTPKDIDYLVTNVSFEVLLEGLTANLSGKILSTDVGDSMNVIKVALGEGEPYDFAIPRKDIYGNSGDHHDLVTIGDPSMSVEDDLSRRDITINAMAENVETGELIDPFDGMGDIHRRIIRAVGEPSLRFREDALRILRIIQFRCRFDFRVDDLTLESMRENRHLLKTISGERIDGELVKAFTKNHCHSNRDLLKMLKVTGVGKCLFDICDSPSSYEDFSDLEFHPKGVNYVHGDVVLTNYVAMFMYGGDYKKLKLSARINDFIEIFRDHMIIGASLLDMLYRKSHYRVDIIHILNTLNMQDQYDDLIFRLSSANKIPLDPKEMNISSEYIIKKGFVGKQISDIQRTMLYMIWEGELINAQGMLELFVDSQVKKD